MNIDEEINNILNSINESDLENLDDIEELRKMAIDKVFGSYIKYPNNNDNKKTAIKELETYEYADIDDLKKGDYVKYFNLRYFTNLRLVIGGTILDNNFNNTGDIKLMTVYGLKIIKPNIFFRRIPSDDLVKMKLIQITDHLHENYSKS